VGTAHTGRSLVDRLYQRLCPPYNAVAGEM
jgi:hypothetical protein